MTDEDPPPLKSAGGTPAELVRALRALGERDRDPARLARVAERLGTRIGAGGPPPAASWLRTLVTTKTGLLGLVLGCGVLGVLGYGLIADHRAPATATEIAAAVAAPAAPAPTSTPASTPAPTPTPVKVAAAPATQLPASATPTVPAPSVAAPTPAFGGTRPRLARSAERSRADAPRAATSQPAPVPAPAPAAAAAPAPAAPTAVAEAKVEPAPAKTSPAEVPAPAQPAAVAPPPTPPPSEVALLRSARKLAAQQPAAALSVLREHAQRFPNGMLKPEREVLTIEALRRLGRTAEATQHLRQFEAQYPKSLYLRRLHEPAASD